MTSRFTFPIRFLDKEILNTICNYYDIDVGRIGALDSLLIQNKPFGLYARIEYMQILSSHHKAIAFGDGLAHLYNEGHHDSQQNFDLVELFQEKKLPYDSLQANGVLLHCYRPELFKKHHQLPYNTALDTPVFPADMVSELLFNIQDADVLVKKLIAGFKQFGGDVPLISSYAPTTSRLFIPLLVDDMLDFS